MKQRKKVSARDYLRVVEWSAEDRCFVGSAPPLIGRCCHGATEAGVLKKLKRIVDEWIRGKSLNAYCAEKLTTL